MPNKKDVEIYEARIKLHKALDKKHHDLMNKASKKAKKANEEGDQIKENRWIQVQDKHMQKVLYHQEKEYNLKQKIKGASK